MKDDAINSEQGTYHKTKAILQVDVTNPPEPAEKLLHVLLTDLVGDPANVHSAHGYSQAVGRAKRTGRKVLNRAIRSTRWITSLKMFGACAYVPIARRVVCERSVIVCGPDKMSSCRVYIGRLSYDAKEKDVERFFRGLGRIRDINLKNGFGFVVSVHSRHFGSSFALSCRSLTALEMLTTPCTSATDKRCWERGEGDGHTHTHARTHARTHTQ